MLTGNVLITGGAGFLGRAILRRAQNENWPAKFYVYSRDEMKQWELKHKYPNVTCIIGDVVRDLDRLIATMHGMDTVIHAAALKFIPEAEWSVSETIDVNINGSRNVAIAARTAGVRDVVGISTDKACGPLNTYGMTKGLMERYFAEANRMGGTRFVTVRYGNVVGSTGSVIPLFARQLAEQGEFRVTDSRMTRFWLGVDEAIDLILWSRAWACDYPGYTFISPCPAMKIVDIAEAVWLQAGMKGDVPVIFTGIRPGEKLHESMFNEQEAPRVSRHPLGYIMSPATEPGELMPERMSYTSDHPNRWITPEEMIRLIDDARGI